jgi:hypothetical protein
MPRRGGEIYSVSRIYFDKEMEGKHKRTEKYFFAAIVSPFSAPFALTFEPNGGKRKANHKAGKTAATRRHHWWRMEFEEELAEGFIMGNNAVQRKGKVETEMTLS